MALRIWGIHFMSGLPSGTDFRPPPPAAPAASAVHAGVLHPGLVSSGPPRPLALAQALLFLPWRTFVLPSGGGDGLIYLREG